MPLRLTIGPCQGNSRLPAGGLVLFLFLGSEMLQSRDGGEGSSTPEKADVQPVANTYISEFITSSTKTTRKQNNT